MPPDLALSSTLIGSNYPCLEHIFMVRKVFEPLKFDCRCLLILNNYRSNHLPNDTDTFMIKYIVFSVYQYSLEMAYFYYILLLCGLEAIKIVSCSTQLSMEFEMLIRI